MSIAFRTLLAFALGALIHTVAVVDFNGMLAAVAVPSEYWNLLDRRNLPSKLVLANLGIQGIPVTLAVCAASFAALHALRLGRRAAWAIAAGMLASILVHTLTGSHQAGSTLAQQLAAWFWPTPWFNAPILAAPWLGLLAAAWMTPGSSRRAAPV